MTTGIQVNRARAFVNIVGEYGNPTGIIFDVDHTLGKPDRQRIAARLRFTDTVFVNRLDPVDLSFHNPQQETKFAGDALISTSFFLRNELKKEFGEMHCKGGQIKTWQEGDSTFIEASLDGTPPWQHVQMDNARAVDSITDDAAEKFEHTMVWAWIDEKKGVVRSRTFLPDWGTLEDQGNGSGSMQLAHIVGKEIEIIQGKGSVIYAKPAGHNSAAVGGRVMVDGLQEMDF